MCVNFKIFKRALAFGQYIFRIKAKQDIFIVLTKVIERKEH